MAKWIAARLAEAGSCNPILSDAECALLDIAKRVQG